MDTQVFFKYGPDDTYGQSTSSQDIGSATSDSSVTVSITGLASHTTYHYTVVAQSIAGTTTAPDATFTTFDNPPAAAGDAATVPYGAATAIDILANDSDPDGDALNITGVTQPGFGTTTTDGSQVIYTPNPHFIGTDSFTYSISDGYGGTSTATVSVTVAFPSSPVTSVLHAKGGAFPGAGISGSGIPGGAVFTTVRNPAINNAFELVYQASWSGGGKPGAAIVREDILGNATTLAVRGAPIVDYAGDPVTSVTYSSFLDPALDEEGAVAFIAKLAGNGLTSANNSAVFATTSTGLLRMIVRVGDTLPSGAVIKSFQSVALAQSDVFAAVTLLGTTTLPGPGGITSANNHAVVHYDLELLAAQPSEIIVQKRRQQRRRPGFLLQLPRARNRFSRRTPIHRRQQRDGRYCLPAKREKRDRHDSTNSPWTRGIGNRAESCDLQASDPECRLRELPSRRLLARLDRPFRLQCRIQSRNQGWNRHLL